MQKRNFIALIVAKGLYRNPVLKKHYAPESCVQIETRLITELGRKRHWWCKYAVIIGIGIPVTSLLVFPETFPSQL